MKVISNSTPLIALAKINKLSLLREYFGEKAKPKPSCSPVKRRDC